MEIVRTLGGGESGSKRSSEYTIIQYILVRRGCTQMFYRSIKFPPPPAPPPSTTPPPPPQQPLSLPTYNTSNHILISAEEGGRGTCRILLPRDPRAVLLPRHIRDYQLLKHSSQKINYLGLKINYLWFKTNYLGLKTNYLGYKSIILGYNQLYWVKNQLAWVKINYRWSKSIVLV